MLHSGKQPLVQFAKRLTERVYVADFNYANNKANAVLYPIIRRKSNICVIELSEFKLSNHIFKDMWFLNKNNKIFQMADAYKEDSSFFVKGYEATQVTELFSSPFPSKYLDIFVVKMSENLRKCPTIINVKDIMCKFVVIKYKSENTVALIPLLHTIK